MENTIYKLDIFQHTDQFVVFFQVKVSLYGRLFNESFRLYYLQNIFTAFAVALSGSNEAKFQKISRKFFYHCR